MAPSTPPLHDSPPVCVPYEKATTQQISLALAYAVRELGQHFPTLEFIHWASLMPQLEPDLWVAGASVYLDENALAYLTQRLATSSCLPQFDPPVYPGRACYLAKRLVNYQDEALAALADIATNPLACGSRVFSLVTSLALGNSVANAVFQVAYQEAPTRPSGVDPARARATAHEQVRELRHARNELGY